MTTLRKGFARCLPLMLLAVALNAECFATPFGLACTPGIAPAIAAKADVAELPAPFVPTFEKVTLKSPWGSYPLNSDYFATAETANTLCERLSCVFVREKAFTLVSEPFQADKPERWLVFKVDPNGSALFEENAGILAAFHKRNPQNLFPTVADKLIAAVLAQDRLYARK